MTYLVLTRSGYEELVRKLQRVPSPLWVNKGVLSQDELAAIRTSEVALTDFNRHIEPSNGQEVEDAAYTVKEHHPNETLWVEYVPAAANTMKNIQVIDGANNSVYDVFAATEKEFSLIFPEGQDVAFIDEVMNRDIEQSLDEAFSRIWKRRISKRDVMGIHGILFYELAHKKAYYPTRKDEEAVNLDGSRLR